MDITTSTFSIRAFESPLSSDYLEAPGVAGMSIIDILGNDLPLKRMEVWLDGLYIEPEFWAFTFPGEGSIVQIRAVPQNETVRAILAIAITVIAVYFAGPAGLSLGQVATAAFVGGVTLAGNLLINALVPPPQQHAPATDSFTRLASITGQQNQIASFAAIPRLLGKMKYFPPVPMTGTPYTYIVGDQQYLKVLLILGYGPLDINGVTVDNTGVKTETSDAALMDAIFIGDTPLSQFTNVRLEAGDPAQMTIYSQSISEAQLNVAMNSTTQQPSQLITETVQQVRTTEVGVDEIAVDLEFPNGLFSLSDQGTDGTAEVAVTFEYRISGSADPWVLVDFITYETHYYEETYNYAVPYTTTTSNTKLVIRGQTRQTIRRGARWPVTNGQYDVRVTRVSTFNGATHIGATDMTWLNLKSIFKDHPFDVPNVVGLALDIKATDNLSGSINNISVLATSILPVWDGATWTNQATSSPAWCFNEVLTGVAARRPLDRDNDVDKQALLDWATQNATDGFEFNSIVEGSTTVFDLIRIIAAAGRASWALKSNLLSVIREETDQIPKQLFSPRNATNFQLVKTFPQIPHALRVQFVDSTTYKDTERLVYDDGYDSSNATLFETLQLPGVTSSDQAWKLGRFHLAQLRLRPETYTFDAYLDQLIATRGDAIGVMDDTFLDGISSGRIKSCNGGNQQVDPGFESGESATAISITETNTTLTIVDGIVGGSRYALRSEGGTQLLTNADWANGFTGWTLGIPAQVSLQTDNVYMGAQGVKITGDGVNAPYADQIVSNIANGDTIYCSVYVMRDENDLPDNTGDLFLNLRDAGGGFLRSQVVRPDPNISGWQYISFSFTAIDATTDHGEVGIRVDTAGVGSWFFSRPFCRKESNDNVVTYGSYVPATDGQKVRVRAFVKRDELALPTADFNLDLEVMTVAHGHLTYGTPSASAIADHTKSGVQEIWMTYTIADATAGAVRLDLAWGGTASVNRGAWIIDDLYIDVADVDGVSTLDVDDTLYMNVGTVYKVAARYVDSTGAPAIDTVDVTTVSPFTKSLTCTTPLPNRVYPGDLFVFGETPITDAKITKIVPTGDDFTATITAVPLAPAILTADQGSIPAYTPLLDQPTDFNGLPPTTPIITSVRSDDFALVRGTDGVLRAAMQINFWFPPGQPKTLVRARYTEANHSLQWYQEDVSSDAGKIVVHNVIKGTSYLIQLQAINQNGLKSAWSSGVTHTVVGKVIEPSDVTGFSATIEDYGIVLNWNAIPDIDRDEYEIRIGTVWDSATFLGRTKSTTLRTGIVTAGVQNFLIKAIDQSKLYSINAVLATATIAAPDVSGLIAVFDSPNIKLSWSGVTSSFQIKEYEIRRGGSDWASATPVVTIRTNVYQQLVDWEGNNIWRVAAIDVAGNVGAAQQITATVTLPIVQSINPQVIDNNVLLRWSSVPGTLNIARYEIRKGDVYASAEVIGLSDTTFSTVVESISGMYTYWVTPIDEAGNYGTAASVIAQVNEPPDFALQSDFISDGFGVNTNVQRTSLDRRSIQFQRGVDDYVALPGAILDGLSDCTVEMAIAFDEPPPAGGRSIVFGGWDGVTNSLANIFVMAFEAVDLSTDEITINLWPYGLAGSVSWTIAGINLFDGRFRMYSIVRNQTAGTVELFIDGVSQGSNTTTLTTLAIGASDLILGTWISMADGTRQYSEAISGRIDEVRFWNVVRSGANILASAFEELALNESGLVAYFRFNLEGNKITADDISPNDHNGSIAATQNLPTPISLVPFPSSEVVSDKSTVHGYATPQAQIDAGYSYVAQPVPTTASIEEIYNVGVVLSTSRIQVLPALAAIVSGVTYSVTISTKQNIGDAWTSYGAGNDDVFATNFQYIKVHIDFTASSAAAFSQLTQLATKGFVKRKTDEGDVVVSANPTTVDFTVAFIDITAITATALGTTFAVPIVDFTDAPNPTSFDLYVFDAAGNPITGRTVHWIARGV